MRLSGTKATAIHQYRGLGNQLWDLAGNRPSLDLRFADNKSIVDATTGTTLVDHNRASLGTYVGSDGLIKTATTNLYLYSQDFSNPYWIKSNVLPFGSGSISGATTAPDGTVTADLVVEDTSVSTSHAITLTATNLVNGAKYTRSVYAKAKERSQIGLNFGQGLGGYFIFDIPSKTFVASGGLDDLDYESLPDGWVRVWMTSTADTSTYSYSVTQIRIGKDGVTGYTGDGTSGIYIWGSQLEQSSTVGEYIPTTSTINSALRFDHDPETGESLGLLVEESRTNLITDSSLTTIGSLASATISSTTETNPEGIDFCRRLLSDAGGTLSGHRIYVAASSSNNITVSAFVKKDTHRYVYIGFGGAFNSFTALFDIDPSVTGDRLLGEGGIGTYTNITAGYQNFPNGWVRIWAVGTTTGTDGTTIGFSPDDSTFNITNWTAAGTEAIFIHGVQYEDNVSFPTSYIPTSGSQGDRAADLVSISGNNFGTTNLLTYSEEFDNASWRTDNASFNPNSAASPTGNFTADELIAAVGGPTSFITYQTSKNTTAGSDYVFSVYAKKSTYDYIQLTNINCNSSATVANFDLATGVKGSTGNSVSTMEPVGNGWYRCSMIFTADNTVSNAAFYITLAASASASRFQPWSSVGGESVYLWGAQLEQSDVVTPYVKSNVTWNSRASNATYYDATGTLRKSSYNLLSRSEEFNDTAWTDSTVTWTPSSVAAPDGTLTVLKPDKTWTFWAFYDQTSAAWIAGYPEAFPFTVTNQWARQSVQVTAPAGCTTLRFYPGRIGVVGDHFYQAVTVIPGETYTASAYYKLDTDGTVLIWGAQLERGPYAGDYAKTEATAASTARNAAYLPDDSGNFISAGPLLLEEQRTNLLPYSEDFSTGWNEVSASVSTNQTTAPDGSTTADKLICGTGTPLFQGLDQSITATGASGKFSVYAKAAELTQVELRTFSSTDFAIFDLNNGTVVSETFGTDAAIVDVGNGWYRCSISSASGITFARISLADGGDRTFTPVADAGIYIWGAQLEEGSYPTSYIPTYGIAADRSADVSTSTSGFGNSWYRQDAGTARVEWHNTAQKSWDRYDTFFAVRNVGATEYFGYGITNGGNGYQVYWSAKTNNNGQLTYGSYSPGFPYIPKGSWTHAIASTTNDAAFYEGGVQRKTDDSITMPSPTEAVFDTTNTCLKRVTFWPTRLSNETLSTITK